MQFESEWRGDEGIEILIKTRYSIYSYNLQYWPHYAINGWVQMLPHHSRKQQYKTFVSNLLKWIIWIFLLHSSCSDCRYGYAFHASLLNSLDSHGHDFAPGWNFYYIVSISSAWGQGRKRYEPINGRGRSMFTDPPIYASNPHSGLLSIIIISDPRPRQQPRKEKNKSTFKLTN